MLDTLDMRLNVFQLLKNGVLLVSGFRAIHRPGLPPSVWSIFRVLLQVMYLATRYTTIGVPLHSKYRLTRYSGKRVFWYVILRLPRYSGIGVPRQT